MLEQNTQVIQKSGVTDIRWVIIEPYGDYKTDVFEVDGIPDIKWCLHYGAPDIQQLLSGQITHSSFKFEPNLESDSEHDSKNEIKVQLVIGRSKTVSSFMEITNSLTNFEKIISDKDLEKFLEYDQTLHLRFIIKIVENEKKFSDNKISTNLKQYLINDALSDVILQINDVKIPAHKIVLASASPVFAKMFSHQMLENITNIVQIKNADLDVFKEMLGFIYSGQINNLGTLAFGLYDIAHEYDVQRLQVLCEEFLQDTLTLDNVVPILELADRHNSAHLKRKCIDFIDEHFDEIGLTDEFKNMKKNLLFEILYSKYENRSKDRLADLFVWY